jgi:hypothetical protein
VPTVFLVDGGGRVPAQDSPAGTARPERLAADVAAFAEQADAAPLVPADDPPRPATRLRLPPRKHDGVNADAEP